MAARLVTTTEQCCRQVFFASLVRSLEVWAESVEFAEHALGILSA